MSVVRPRTSSRFKAIQQELHQLELEPEEAYARRRLVRTGDESMAVDCGFDSNEPYLAQVEDELNDRVYPDSSYEL